MNKMKIFSIVCCLTYMQAAPVSVSKIAKGFGKTILTMDKIDEINGNHALINKLKKKGYKVDYYYGDKNKADSDDKYVGRYKTKDGKYIKYVFVDKKEKTAYTIREKNN